MLSCKEATRLASEALDHPLPLGQRLALKLHLMICSPCNRFARQINRLEQLYRRYGDQRPGDPGPSSSALSPSARARIEQKIAAKLAAHD